MESGDEMRRLREVLEPRPESVERVVRGALDRRPARSPRLVPAVAGLAALLALAAIGLLAPRPRAAVASIENVGEVLIVRQGKEEGGRRRIHNGIRGEGSSPSGSIIVIHGGAR